MSLEAWGDDGDADRPYTQERVDELIAEATAELRAEIARLRDENGRAEMVISAAEVFRLCQDKLESERPNFEDISFINMKAAYGRLKRELKAYQQDAKGEGS